ncbi:tetratricopeptide repeat protein [Vulcaniibacterium tengchongense]|uniref:Cytochrome c-type biogenesis protein CcmH n=1 Tax=Vulcaniibacterium tengchongense TaxID=1273429 RepID=A0A3N4VEQ0_9GAMM|nr:tetratricopeptide repeat protein [Vulcaniibacterium tengchongense]RPE81462.1 cytochrome c-type biogenesis protein CcmH [Vulcaniibacterium tengchongense]
MTAFALAGLALAVLVLAYVLRPLWRTRPAAGFGAVAGLTLAAGLLYFAIGTPQALDPARRKAPETLDEAIAQLEAQLRREPNSIEGWRLLGRAYLAEGRGDAARDVLARALKLAPDDPDLLAEAAEVRALAAPQRRFDEEGVAMLRRALQQQPMHQRARWFLGIAQRQAQQPAEAARTWEPLLGVVTDPATASSLRQQIDAARRDAGLPPLPASPAAAAAAEAAPALLRVTVELAPELRGRLGADAALFVLARQPGGPPMPVAAKRLPATGFPLTVELGDGDSPMPTLKLSQLRQVQLQARISQAGTAERGRGDLESAPQPAQPGAESAYTLRIDRVVE